MAHEEGNLHSFAAILGNDVAIKAYREGKLPYPDGTIIAALHYGHVPSQENNKVFDDPQSFVPGPPTNVQFMVKDSKKYASTGGWGSLTSAKTANLATRRCSRPAPLATQRLLATLYSHGTHLDTTFRLASACENGLLGHWHREAGLPKLDCVVAGREVAAHASESGETRLGASSTGLALEQIFLLLHT